jgi:hypothetical protein
LHIRIIRAEYGEIDGIDLSTLRLGTICDLPTSLATYLILNGTGELVELRAVDDEERIAMNVQLWREIAANGTDESRRRKADSTHRKNK